MNKTIVAAGLASVLSTTAMAESIGVSMALFDDNFLTVLRNGMIDYARSLDGVDIQVEDAQNDVGRQLNQIQNFVASGVDAIIVNPVDTDATVAMTQVAAQAGIPLVFVNRQPVNVDDLPENQAFIASDEIEAGISMTLRFGLLGAGRIGKVHACAIAGNPDAKLVAIADAMPEAAEALAAEYGAETRSIDAIEAAGDIDAVVICTPTHTHADLIERFARRAKGIFCEKPVDLSLARVRGCLAVVEETGATLMVGFNRRFDPDFNALKATIAEGRIGAVEMVTLTSRDPAPPPYGYIERSGGIFRDMTVHDFDMARWLLGEEVETMLAAASVLVDPEIGRRGDYDSANVILRTASGRQCTITKSRRATYGYDQRVEVLGSKGAVAAGNTRLANIEIANADGFTRPPLLDFFMTRYTAAYAAEIAAFVAALRDRTPPPVTGHDGLMALALADAALKSVAEARAVRLAEILD